MDRGELYNELIKYVSYKFASRPNISEISKDIVGEVYLDFYAKYGTASDRENFGYLSVACIRKAYKKFKAWDINASRSSSLDDCLSY